MKLSSVREVPEGVKVILRLDTDLPMEDGRIIDNSRLVKSLPTVKLLLEKKCQLAILGHRGRPEGRDENLSLKPVYLELMSLLENGQNWVESVFVEELDNGEMVREVWEKNTIIFGENLRFWPGEEKNDDGFLEELIKMSEWFVNDAIAVAHREHASVQLWKKMKTAYGLNFGEEIERLSVLRGNPERPLTIILGGAKEDKLGYLPELVKMADWVLVGGKLPRIMQNPTPRHDVGDLPLTGEAKIVIAKLREDGLDLAEEDIVRFKEIITKSKTIVWAGAMGFYEEIGSRKGTEEVARAVAGAWGYKVVAGGDTGASIVNLGLKDRINWICTGGGATLEFLTKGKLAAWGEK